MKKIVWKAVNKNTIQARVSYPIACMKKKDRGLGMINLSAKIKAIAAN